MHELKVIGSRCLREKAQATKIVAVAPVKILDIKKRLHFQRHSLKVTELLKYINYIRQEPEDNEGPTLLKESQTISSCTYFHFLS